ncbi:MAG: dephospho-CoA kinase [Lachnospiraceae bacterium]|nr:dephospho-CoA kinase [Lachnospiraceae bacterium]
MKIIGITGGVGAGKSTVLDILKNACNCFIIMADEAAREIEKKGQSGYEELVGLLGSDILDKDGSIDRKRMAAIIFKEDNRELLGKVNAIIHPRVKEYILSLIEEKRKEGRIDYFFIEAALLIEDGYKSICQELWYIYASEDVRISRLKESRGYSDKKIREIMNSQCDEETFRKYCDRVIDNNSDILTVKNRIFALLEQ